MSMSIVRVVAVAALAAVAAGCAVRPLPDNVAGSDTYTIVKRIRCETYHALRNDFIALIERAGRRDAAARLRAGTLDFDDLNAGNVGAEALRVVNRYRRTTIGYSFTFDITEANNLSGGTRFLRPFGRGPAALGFEVGTERTRQNVRTFRVIDVWEDLLSLLRKDFCSDFVRIDENLIYPISGRIGMKNQIRLFYDLNQSGNLAGNADNVPTLTDTVTFRTTVRGSASPSIEIAPLTSDFQLASANAVAEARRDDIHKVIIVMALPPADAPRFTPIAKERAIIELQREEALQSNILDRRALESVAREIR